ncbi:uncharacterized protein EDB91DRAFT_1255177 [Suillus paluster]|uniref:uncharacterized protein n=1 Tax=Suillus paluster TaxID=48578 RepID=UPI001B8831CB|nr:uncharacterized protein EDB91DRAFT_1255177 [Suillus paluster]KAG1724584.1 hypothetical protein EDB91DRAFT_1255177 [Suillus paluster]
MSSPPSEDHDNGLADVEPGIFQDAPDDANFADYLGPAAEEPRSSPLPDVHVEFFGPRDSLYRNHHTLLDGRPCDKHGNFLPDGTPPPPAEPRSCNDWTPLRNCVEFENSRVSLHSKPDVS